MELRERGGGEEKKAEREYFMTSAWKSNRELHAATRFSLRNSFVHLRLFVARETF